MIKYKAFYCSCLFVFLFSIFLLWAMTHYSWDSCHSCWLQALSSLLGNSLVSQPSIQNRKPRKSHLIVSCSSMLCKCECVHVNRMPCTLCQSTQQKRESKQGKRFCLECARKLHKGPTQTQHRMLFPKLPPKALAVKSAPPPRITFCGQIQSHLVECQYLIC